MSRTRIVKGKYTKIVGGNYNISAEGSIISNAAVEVREKGNEYGVTYGNFERKGSDVNEDFEITFSRKKDKGYSTVVPLGILDFEGKYENAQFVFDYSLMLSNIDSLEFKVLNEDGNVLFAINNLPTVTVVAARRVPLLMDDIAKNKPKYDTLKPVKMWDWRSIFDSYNITSGDYTKIGSYVIFWDGFDNDGIYDSTNFNNKKLKAQIIARKNGKEKTKEVEFFTEYAEVDWVDVKIDKNNKRIDTTLRVNLKDGGEKGLECNTFNTEEETSYETFTPTNKTDPFKNYKTTICDWDKIPDSEIVKWGKPPIKTRTRSFEDLEKLAIEGLKTHWSRSPNNGLREGNFIKIFNEKYELNLLPINTPNNALNKISLLYNTNNSWGRSGNPGFLAELFYNVGYIEYSDGWGYQNEFFEDIEFRETVAHEIGHPILLAYGNTNYSWEHKGSSYLFPQDTKPTLDNRKSKIIKENLTHLYTMNTSGEYYPATGEIDLMKYYNSKDPDGKEVASPDSSRTVISEKDSLGLIWLTKIKIK